MGCNADLSKGAREKPTFRDARHVLTIEERIQMAGAASFQQFEMFVITLLEINLRVLNSPLEGSHRSLNRLVGPSFLLNIIGDDSLASTLRQCVRRTG